MDLETFVAETLRQVLAGVRKAQAGDNGREINWPGNNHSPGGHLYSTTAGVFTRVDFDVAITATTEGKLGAGLKVFSIEMGAGGSHSASHANRVSFSVPVRLPEPGALG